MKRIVLLISSLLVLSAATFGQSKDIYENPKYGADSASRMQCAGNLSIVSQYVKIKTYDYAYTAWREAFNNCPKSSKNIYIHGRKILHDKISKAPDEATKMAWVDTLMIMYDTRINVYGEKDPAKVYATKGNDLLRFKPSAIEEAFGYLEKALDLKGKNFKESVAVTYMSTTQAMLKQGIVGPDVMIENYVKVMDLFDQKLGGEAPNSKESNAIESIEKMFAESGAADCESLISIFTPKYETAPEDIAQLKKITTLLSNTDCEDSELYAKAAESLFKLEPSADAAAKLAGLFAVKEEFGKAKEYYNTAIEQQIDSELKAKYYFQLGRIAFQEKDFPTSRKHCNAAIALKSNMGDAYLLIGDAYVSSKATCGSSDFEKNAVFWAAVDKYQKAKSVDASVAEKASEKIKLYSQYYPNKEEAFFNNAIEGETYKVGCWIQESTRVRF